ncbi:uncharacterized protein LOC114542403 [Dendronephthya gigantea]|uniref:uncharacterized protein LOC114542403 n=1 Tax=Dendronephthya gigantea TaxID=151771 RepID=UPI00106A1CBB|nr:uncharacterized protein LOC114542403 [Dendronephthya gigantea]
MKLILLRSRIWKVISQETEKATPTDNSNPTTKALVEKRNIDMVVCVDDHVDLSGDDTLSSSSSSSTDDKGLTEAGKVAKVVHLMKNVHLLFGSGKLNKSAKKLIDLIYLIKDHEDPEAVCSRRQGKSMPLLCLDKTSAYLICQGTLIFTVALKSLMRAVLALIGLFYVIDVDYPKSHELGLTMLHNLFINLVASDRQPHRVLTPIMVCFNLLFKDMNTPADLYNSFESANRTI